MELEIKLAECNIASLVSADVISGKDPNAANSYEKPDAVKAVDHDKVCVKNGNALVKLPPLCVYAATFSIG